MKQLGLVNEILWQCVSCGQVYSRMQVRHVADEYRLRPDVVHLGCCMECASVEAVKSSNRLIKARLDLAGKGKVPRATE